MSRTKCKDRILPGELRVLEALKRFKTYEEAAKELFISRDTASTHMRNARARNNVNNNYALLTIAYEDGLLPIVIKSKAAPGCYYISTTSVNITAGRFYYS